MKKLLVLFIVLFFSSACSIVSPGQRGIRVSLGKASDDILQPGAYLWVPFVYGVKKLNVQIQKSEVDSSASSKDLQEIKSHVAINWNIDPSKVVSFYKELGDPEDMVYRILSPSVNEVMKAATAHKTAEQVLTQRFELKAEMDKELEKRLIKYGVIVKDFNIVNITFYPEFSQAIERKQVAEQAAKQAEYEAQKATQDAKAAIERAKGEAESQRLIERSLTRPVLEKLAIDKWDGSLPQVVGVGQSFPMLQLLQKTK